MSFQPVLPASGLIGWRFLQRTMTEQTAAFDKAPALARDTAYFEQKIGSITTAEALVDDRRLLRVALGAFGLQDDIDSRAFIRKVLAEGTTSRDALANRLADERYRTFSAAFGFGTGVAPRTTAAGFGREITALYRQQQFEVAIGGQDDTMRLALNAERTLGDVGRDPNSDTTRWFRIMGNPPLRTVFETALGLPKSFGKLDIDKQREVFADKARSQLGLTNLDQLANPEMREKLVQRFLLRADAAASDTTAAGSIALTLLQAARPIRR